MTIEEKARAYDEAFKEAEKIHKFSSDFAEIKRMEQIFPELKESENEKIRKEIITYCRNIRCVTEEGAEKIAKWLTWLEKQGKTSPVLSNSSNIGKIEQDPDDKVEPKFKNGQWLVWKDKYYKVNYNCCGWSSFNNKSI